MEVLKKCQNAEDNNKTKVKQQKQKTELNRTLSSRSCWPNSVNNNDKNNNKRQAAAQAFITLNSAAALQPAKHRSVKVSHSGIFRENYFQKFKKQKIKNYKITQCYAKKYEII